MKEQTLTFAILCQIVSLVQKISRGEPTDTNEISLILRSITITSSDDTLEIYGGELQPFKDGLSLLINHLGDKTSKKDPEFTRYIVGLLNLERRLTKQPKKMALLAERIEQTQRQLSHYEITSDTLFASFASIYSDIISPLGSSIQVTGEPSILKQSINQHKIRALLLAGIRAAVLWRQIGGKRRNILFYRSRMVKSAQELRQAI